MAGIYIHIPFCRKACHYCNFHFSTSPKLQANFVEALLTEISLQKHFLKEPVSTIYLGGGTPSILESTTIDLILQTIKTNFSVEAGAEITLEANPDDISIEKLTGWLSIGINRLSIGIQSFFEEDLVWMNRAHNAKQALRSVELARREGFDNLTIDLIYGTPTLTNDRWLQNLQKAISLQVPHLSCYALTVEPKTALHALIEKNKVANVDTDKQAVHFELLVAETEKHGYEQYEISNFAKPGFRSRHNSSYWQGKPYLGLGPSAHSFNGVSRQWNVANNALYINSLQNGTLRFEKEELTKTNRFNEYVMTSLRTIEGLSIEKVTAEFGEKSAATLLSSASKHIKNQHLFLNDQHLKITRDGRFLADGIAADLFQL